MLARKAPSGLVSERIMSDGIAISSRAQLGGPLLEASKSFFTLDEISTGSLFCLCKDCKQERRHKDSAQGRSEALRILSMAS